MLPSCISSPSILHIQLDSAAYFIKELLEHVKGDFGIVVVAEKPMRVVLAATFDDEASFFECSVTMLEVPRGFLRCNLNAQ